MQSELSFNLTSKVTLFRHVENVIVVPKLVQY